MRKLIIALVPSLLLAAAALPAFADTQPTNGVASDGRNPSGFGGGPHCHINLTATEHQQAGFGFIAVYPSHTAHVQTGLPTGIFAADPNCDGDPGS